MQSSVALTINCKTVSATHNHFPPGAPDCVKLSDLERTFGNYILHSILLSFLNLQAYLNIKILPLGFFFRIRNIKNEAAGRRAF